MSFDHHALLAVLVEREEREPGVDLDGLRMVQTFSWLVTDSPQAWELVTRAAAQLRQARMDRLAIRALAPRHGGEAGAGAHGDHRIEQVRDIVVTEKGLVASASRKEEQAIAPQINVINSTIGQLALGNIHNVTMTTILDAVETSYPFGGRRTRGEGGSQRRGAADA